MIETRRRSKKTESGGGWRKTPSFLNTKSKGRILRGQKEKMLQAGCKDSQSLPPWPRRGPSFNRRQWGPGPGTCRATLTSPICNSTSSSGSTVRPLPTLGTGQSKLTGTPGDDVEEGSEDEGEKEGGGDCEETRTSSLSAMEKGRDCRTRTWQNRHQLSSNRPRS